MTTINCPNCGHDIDRIDPEGCSELVPDEYRSLRRCDCWKSPSDIARALLTADPTAAEVEAAAREMAGAKSGDISGGFRAKARRVLIAARKAQTNA